MQAGRRGSSSNEHTELKGESVTTSLVTSDTITSIVTFIETTNSEGGVGDRACRSGEVKEQKRGRNVKNKRKKLTASTRWCIS